MTGQDDGAEDRIDAFMDAFGAQYEEVFYIMLPDHRDRESLSSPTERQAAGFPDFPTHERAEESRKLAEAAGRIPPGCWVKGVLRRVETDGR